EMKKEGYPENFSAAVNITSATTGLSIPPSNILIVYSLASGGVSITALFLAGYLPGILTGLAIMLTAVAMLIFRTKGRKAAMETIGIVAAAVVVIFAVYQLVMFSNDTFSPVVNRILLYLVLAAIAIWMVIRTRNNKEKALEGTKKFLDAIPSLLMLVIV